MQTITIEILNKKAFRLLQNLERLKLIRLRKERKKTPSAINWVVKYKGTMTKQPLFIIDQQLSELRSEWE